MGLTTTGPFYGKLTKSHPIITSTETGLRLHSVDSGDLVGDGVKFILRRDVTYKGIVYAKGSVGRVFWVGEPRGACLPDGFKGPSVTSKSTVDGSIKVFAVGAASYVGIRIGADGVFLESKDLERHIRFPVAPFKVGDRIKVRGITGTVFTAKQQVNAHHIRHVGGKKGVRYGRPAIDGAIGDWLLGIKWEEGQLLGAGKTVAGLRKWVYADGYDVEPMEPTNASN